MRTCPSCHQEYSEAAEICPLDGTPLPPELTPADKDMAKGLASRYRIVRRLGTGGMGTVFLAEQIAVGNRPVALKILHRKLLDDPEFLMRFQNEAASTGRIRHPNVVVIYESGQSDDGSPYIAMEYLEGHPVRQILKDFGPLPLSDTVEILQQVARGLSAAHKLGIIHRDLKPDNIFMTRSEEGLILVKVVDFGIAKLLDAATHTLTGVVLGTPAYMSYEQASGMRSDEVDTRSDIYSLGVVAYEMLTGRVPFSSDTPLGYVRKHMTEEPPPLKSVKPDLRLPQQLEDVVLKALRKDRNQRYSSALEFAHDFAEAAFPSPEQEADSSEFLKAQTPSRWNRGATTGSSPSPASVERKNGAGIQATPPTPPGVRAEPKQEKESSTGAVVPLETLPSIRKAPSPPPRKPAGPLAKRAPRPPILSLASQILIAGLLLLLAAYGWIWYRAQRPAGGMAYIPGGSFIMGCDKCQDAAERPAHLVTVGPYYIDRTPVTNVEYAAFVQSTGHAPPPNWTQGTYPAGEGQWPVTNVTWDDAQAYAKWKGKRLPTEAEWEFAARGSDGRAYPWGNTFEPRLTNTLESGIRHLQPVGMHPNGASPFGVLDMSGNVWQWCQDAYQLYGGRLPNPPIPVTAKVLRGGSFESDKIHVTATTRNMELSNNRSNKIGFRCAKSP